MRAKDFIFEDNGLSLGKLTKRPHRPGRFIELVKQGHTFSTKSGQQIQIDPVSVPELEQDIQAKNSRMKVKTTTGLEMPIGNIVYDDAVFSAGLTGRYASKAGDTTVKLKPANVFQHGDPTKGQEVTPELALDLGAFPAGELGQRIIGNQHLAQQGQAGQVVIEIAKEIEAGQVPTAPKLEPKTLSTIQNDAFEYLGVLALVDGVANFPESEAFYKHVGSDLKSLLLLFPQTTNNPLTDSYALKSTTTGNSIFISSKGGKGSGAASSLLELKIPDYMQGKGDDVVDFMELIKNYTKGADHPGWLQVFAAAEFIHDRFPGALGELDQFVPFDRGLLNYLGQTLKTASTKGVPSTLADIPEEYQDIFALVAKNTQGSNKALFYNIRNYVKDVIHDAVNSGRALPGFSDRMSEILGFNFVVLVTKPQAGKFITDVKWPSRMGGKVELAHKDSADKWGGSITWKLK
jgi:hypothetical protein